jgi:hypothetical protein
MNKTESKWQAAVSRLLIWGICLMPSVLRAHPGHYHPDETDEFDFLRASFFHTHGALELSLACVAVAAGLVALLHKTPLVRVGALAMGLCSIVVIAIR